MRLPWPEFPSTHRPDETIREILDYLAWIAATIAEPGYHTDAGREGWRARVQRAYAAMFLPPVTGHGDPYPPDVPPPVSPGIWPDVPAAGVPGMTVRHQLKVIALRAEELRDQVWAHAKPELVAEWDRRVALAREALDHGEDLPLPDDARTKPSEEILAEARAQEEAFKEHARKRAQRLQRLRAQATQARQKRPAKARKPEKAEKAAPKQKAAGRKKAAPKKKAAPGKKATPRKKATPGKKATPKRKAATRKTAAAKKKAAPRKKAAAKAKAAPRKKTPAKPKKKPASRRKAGARKKRR